MFHILYLLTWLTMFPYSHWHETNKKIIPDYWYQRKTWGMRRSEGPHAVQWFKKRTQENDRLHSDTRNIYGLYRRFSQNFFLKSNQKVSEISGILTLLHHIILSYLIFKVIILTLIYLLKIYTELHQFFSYPESVNEIKHIFELTLCARQVRSSQGRKEGIKILYKT